MFKKPSGQVKLQKLPARPTESDLKDFVKDAVRGREFKFNYFWTASGNEKQEFMVSVKYTGSGEETCEWRMFKGAGTNAKELWFHITRDIEQIYSLIIKELGEDLQGALSTDRQKKERKQTVVEQLSTTFDGSVKIPVDELQRLRPQESALSGELSLVHITNILQSISIAAMTGRLKLNSQDKHAFIYFVDGQPVHATGTMGDGMECMLRAIGLEHGQFQFEPKLRTDEITITEGLESLILSGVHLLDNTRYLQKQGISNDTILARKNPDLSEREFEELVSRGEPINLSMLKAFYLLVDGKLTLKELINRMALPRSKWVPVVSNLVRCDTVIVGRQHSPSKVRVDPKFVEPQVLEPVLNSVIHKETGILTFPMIVYMLRHEAARTVMGHPLTLVLFQIQPQKAAVGSFSRTLPSAFLKELMGKIAEMKRPIDLLGHFDKGAFALVLPEMRALDAPPVAEKIMSTFRSMPIIQNVDARTLSMEFGIASIPDDVTDGNTLMSAAELALNQCKTRSVSVFMAQDIDR